MPARGRCAADERAGPMAELGCADGRSEWCRWTRAARRRDARNGAVDARAGANGHAHAARNGAMDARAGAADGLAGRGR